MKVFLKVIVALTIIATLAGGIYWFLSKNMETDMKTNAEVNIETNVETNIEINAEINIETEVLELEEEEENPLLFIDMNDVFDWTPEIAEDYLLEDSGYDIAETGLFYFGSFTGFDPATRSFYQARKTAVADIVKIMDESDVYMEDITISIMDLRALFDWYVLSLVAISDEEDLLEFIDVQNATALLTQVKSEFALAISQELQGVSYGIDWGRLQYLRYNVGVVNTFTYQQEYEELLSKFLALYLAAEAEASPSLAELNKDVDIDLEEISTKLIESLSKLHYNNAAIQESLDYVYSADVYYAKDSLALITKEIAILEAKITAYINRDEIVTDDTIIFMQAMLGEAREQQQILEILLQNSEIPKIAQLEDDTNSFFPIVHAGVWNTLANLNARVTSAANTPMNFVSKGAGMVWDATKTLVIGAKDLSLGSIKLVGQAVGSILEVADKGVKSTLDVGMGAYYGVPISDVGDAVAGNIEEMVTNLYDGRGGAQVFNVAKEYMNVVDNAVGVEGERLIEGVIGEGYISKGVGFVAKTTSGFLTGTAKDIYDTLNPDSSELTRVMGVFGLGLTAVGGTNSIVKPTDILKSAGGATKKMLATMWKGVKNIDPKKVTVAMTEFCKDGFKKTVLKIFSKEGREVGSKMFTKLGQLSYDSLLSKMSNGYKFLKGNITKEVPIALKNLSNKQNMGGALNEILGTTGLSAKEWALGFANKILGSQVDAQTKKIVQASLGAMGFSNDAEDKGVNAKIVVDEMKVITEKNYPGSVEDLPNENQTTDLTVVKDVLEDVLPVEPVVEELIDGSIGVVTDYQLGGHAANIKYSDGAALTGSVNLTVNADATVSCALALKFVSVGTDGGINGKLVSTSCTGTMLETGRFTLAGSMSGVITMTLYGSSGSSESTQPFTLSGNINEDRSISGNVILNGEAIPFR